MGPLVTGHFGEWLQGRMGPAGPVVLVTVACDQFWMATGGETAFRSPFSEASIEAFLAQLGLGGAPCELASNMRLGVGAGASTASLVALARSAGFNGLPDELAAACLAIEGATDPLMFPTPDRLLWASRAARIVSQMPPPPVCDIVGGEFGAPVPTDPADQQFPDVEDLCKAWPTVSDLSQAATIASESARRLSDFRGETEDFAELARDMGARGHVRAHTGCLRGLIFEPGRVPTDAHAQLEEAGGTSIIQFRTGGR
ncbi:MAG: hypothetical protein AAF762_04860 [Pseudomonadota bacterium]